jgi:serine/threonine-protein kinase
MSLLPEQADREARLDEALGAYFAEAAAGGVADRRDFLARHPDLAADLERFFADDDSLNQLLWPLRLPRTPSPPAGTALGDYDLLGVIGSGGTGVVYKARQRSLNRLVALKMVRGGTLASSEGLRRFRAEAETVAALDYPNIVPVYEVGEHAGQLFFTMKLLTGGDLARWFTAEAPQPGSGTPDRSPPAAARMMVEVARAVHHAHKRGVLHRDLKPSNVLLDAAGRPHVADFGLAKWLTGDASLTETGALVGTPSYMAPEQAAGRVEDVGPPTDVYGLGGVLYALLTGRAPFRGRSALETLEQVRNVEPVAPSRLEPGMPRDLDAICMRCLEKEPRRRYPSAQALAEDLQRFLEGRPTWARPVGWLSRAWNWLQRPERIRDAGVFTILLNLTLLVWCLTALLIMATGFIRPVDPARTMTYIAAEIVLSHAPYMLLGYLTVRRRAWAIVAGCVLTTFHAGMAVDEILNARHDAGGLYTRADPGLTFAFGSLFTFLIAIQLGAFVVALWCYYANRTAIRWMVRARLIGGQASPTSIPGRADSAGGL